MKSASGSPNHATDRRRFPRDEALRWGGLLAAALWLAHPYFSPRLIGTGDAIWYHHLLADVVVQFRSGEFPVFVGQSEFQFNGAVYPHRVAPYHQYFAALIDLLTGRSLGFFALQHLTIILSFVGGAWAAYFALTRLTAERRWLAAALAVLYVACPGVMGLAYAQDLYMSVMTLPWVPLALGGAWLTYRENSWRALGMIVAGLGALWWSHPPIALWVTLLIGGQQIHRLIVTRPVRPLLTRGLAGVAMLGLLIAYPIVSAYQLRAPGESVVPYLMDRALLLKEISGVFPASVRPIDPSAAPLSHLQLGYALWLLLAGLMATLAWRRAPGIALATGFAILLLVLVLPVPGVTRALWLAFPEPLVGLSLYWPMQRLYIIAATLVIVGLAGALADARLPRRLEQALALVLVLATVWSAMEARMLHRLARASAAANAGDEHWSRSENVTPTRHAYHLFARQPATMSHGVMDPGLESRLLDPATGLPIGFAARPGEWLTFTGTLDANPGILNLAPALRLEPGQRHLLTFDFFPRDYTGLLQIIGPGFHREYLLPASGNTRAFGSGPNASRSIAVWTSDTQPAEVRLRFIPTKPGVRADSFTPFARYQFMAINPAEEPVELHTLIPYRATVRTPQPALLETPRMAVPGYTATVAGAPVPVRKSAEGFVSVPVGAGESEVVVRFTGSLFLRAAFALSAVAWLALPCLLWYAARRPVD